MAGRPREFKEDQVLEQAMQAFWAHGYEATSMATLVEVTGLHKGSLYQAFGNKHQLFIKALNRYLDDMRVRKNALLAGASSPLDGINAVLHGMVDVTDDDDECPKGCLAINSLVELAPHDPEVRELMNQHMRLMRESMTQEVRHAQSQGELGAGIQAETVTMMLLTFMSGLATQMKAGIGKAQAHELLDAQVKTMAR